MMPGDSQAISEAVSVSLKDLENGSVTLGTLEQAFGPASLGIMIVHDLPERFAVMRSRLLAMSSYLGNLTPDQLAQVERPDANYGLGWSCGKETLADGRYDTLKGSFYANPVHNAALQEKACELYPNNPEFTKPNVWPSEQVLPGFEEAFESLCSLIIDVAALVARSCDRYGVAKLEGYQAGTLENIVRSSVATKARLLHYFPPLPAPDASTNNDAAVSLDDDWCATHKDLGALTGLTSQMFVDEHECSPCRQADGSFSPLRELQNHPEDTRAGLWIRDRSGRATQVDIPRNCLGFQTGEALESITRGKFLAVPHFVRGASAGKSGKIARNTLAVFTQPNLWDMVDEKRDFATMAKMILDKGL